VISTSWDCLWQDCTRFYANSVGKTKSKPQIKRAVSGTALSHESWPDQTPEKLLLFLSCRRRTWRSGRGHLCRLRGALPCAVHAFLKTSDPFAQAAHNFRNLLAAKQKHHD